MSRKTIQISTRVIIRVMSLTAKFTHIDLYFHLTRAFVVRFTARGLVLRKGRIRSLHYRARVRIENLVTAFNTERAKL